MLPYVTPTVRSSCFCIGAYKFALDDPFDFLPCIRNIDGPIWTARQSPYEIFSGQVQPKEFVDKALKCYASIFPIKNAVIKTLPRKVIHSAYAVFRFHVCRWL